MKPSAQVKNADVAPVERPARSMFTFRIISLLDLLRRSGTLANRREFGLSGLEWRIMAQVGEHAPLSLNALADLLNLDRGQLSRAVKAMVERGLVDSRRKPGGPAIVITLSEAGRALHVRMHRLAAERNQFLVGDIPEDEIERALRVLDAVTRKAHLLLERERAENNQAAADDDVA
nr:MarR family [uncultured organism]